ncbi:choice-of-anchor D domain-containing protein [Microlunatus flavus]|uniref:PQQ-like domain-containing protein n=1 Tax=Microlunatus flavus TaxID=1036181 RepID=A0A1H9NJE6_9ACTN|nr:choice-of-anchor D domain-containing protein [Microlunatus flavus]SER35769.1 PQQ-like domain-containing protein [Microlunatus flavus]
MNLFPRPLRAVSALALAGLVSASLVVAGPASADVTTVSTDNLRTGWDADEAKLAPSDVSAPDFGQLFATKLDGQIYAQPVVAKGTLLAVTEKNKAYGLDPVTGKVRWSRDVGKEWAASHIGCGDLVPTIGITATPAVDAASGTAYFTAKVDDGKDADHPHWYMHAIDITNGTERPGFPTTIKGAADNDDDHDFNPKTAMQRPGLLLLDGVVYAGFASHCDHQPYVGYVVGVDAKTGKQTSMFATETGNSKAGAGIWQSGGGLMSDGKGQVIFATGNGVSPSPHPGKKPPSQLAESVVRVTVQGDRTLKATDFFSPVNNSNLDTDDTDLGSGAPMAIPDGYGTADHPHLMVMVGKDGRVFLLDRDDFGGSGQKSGKKDDVLQVGGPYKGVWGHPAFWGGGSGYVYMVTNRGPLSAFKVGVSGSGKPTLSRVGTSRGNFGYTSGSPTVTSNGKSAGSALVWTVYSKGPTGAGGQLRAYDAVPVKGKMVQRYAAPIGTATKFSKVASDNGRVYVANRSGEVYGFGRPTTLALTSSPTDFGLVAVDSAVTKQVTVTAKREVKLTKVRTEDPFTVGKVKLPVTLKAGASLSVPVTYKPDTAESLSGAISFVTTTGTFAFDLHGTGTKDGLLSDPSTLEFGEVPVGGNVTLDASISNTGSTTTTIGGSTAPSGPFSTDSLPRSGTRLEPGSSLSVPVTFEPTAAGTFSSTLKVKSSTGDVSIPVTGTSIKGESKLTLTPGTVQFGSVQVGKSVTKTFDIKNEGNLLLTLTKAAPPTAPFDVPDPVSEGQQLEPGDVIHQSVTFSPKTPGSFDGTYLITGNDGQGAHTVAIQGTAVAKPVTSAIVGLGDRCVDVRKGKTKNGTAVQLYTCNGSDSQTWARSGDTLQALGKCLDVKKGGTKKGTKVQLWGCNDTSAQQWSGGPDGSLVNAASGKCLDIPKGISKKKVQLQIWTCNGSDAQRWVLKR